MKPDVLTITTLVFVIGVLVSSIDINPSFGSHRDAPPSPLQLGVALG